MMFPTPNSIKTLRAYYKDRLARPSSDDLNKELLGESDRAKIILSSTLLEDYLVFRLATCLTFKPDEDQFDYIFRFEGPLGTFSSRIEIAYMFGFIDLQTRDQLDIIRELRNACAHSKHVISFATTELANVARRLFQPRGFIPLQNDSADELRNSFIAECAVLGQILLEGSREKGIRAFRQQLGKSVAERPPSPNTPLQP